MAKVDVYNINNEKVSEIELNDEVFNIPVKGHILHQVLISQLSNKRRGTASTKSRSQVKASTRKLWRQKGTGRARVGSASSPIRRGGGVAFGPKPRSFIKKVPKKVRKLALKMALSDKFKSNKLVVLDSFELPQPKTKEFVKVMDRFELKNSLIVIDNKNENLDLASRNVPGFKLLRREGINVYDILTHDHLVFVESAIRKIEEALTT